MGRNRAAAAVIAVAAVAVLAVTMGTSGTLAGAAPAPVLTTTAPGGGALPDRTIWEFQSTQAPDAFTTSSPAWVDVPGASVRFATAINTLPVFNATYSAESVCSGGAGCSVRILMVTASGGFRELKPAVGLDFSFDAPGGGAESHTVQRTSDPVPGGSMYEIKVQAAMVGGATLQLDDSDFTVIRVG
jgi:hypothetical protein